MPDGEVSWQLIPMSEIIQPQNVTMIVNGLKWIRTDAAAHPGPKLVTMSTFQMPATPGVSGDGDTLERAIRDLIADGIPVFASANNQNGNACDTSPARLSAGNPDSSLRSDVITVGGSMLVNRPWTPDLSDAPSGATAPSGRGRGPEPPYDPNQAVREARWICGLGDTARCQTTDLHDPPLKSVSPTLGRPYIEETAGSNGGQCVTLFAPAKNLFLASNKGETSYRDGRLDDEFASGTSFSAPIAAGVAARILQQSPTLTPAQLRAALLAHTVAITDPGSPQFPLNPPDSNGQPIAGTPNAFLQLGDLSITQPASTAASMSGTTPLTAVATPIAGTAPVYQWYEVNAGFDTATYRNGAHSSTLITGATSSTFNAPASSSRKAYWARATSSCGSADTNIAFVVPRPSRPSNVRAIASGAIVLVTWSPVLGAEAYVVERKVTGQPWRRAAQVSSATSSFSETPATPDGIVVYRVSAAAGVGYLPSGDLATSAPSNADFANTNTYEALVAPPAYTTIKAQQLIELRQAVNAICDAVGLPAEYSSSELLLSSLQFHDITAGEFTALMAHINHVRTNAAVNVGPAAFTQTPAATLLVGRIHLQDLRDALK